MSLSTKAAYIEQLIADSTQSAPEPCPICYADIKLPFKTAYNHIFCVDCLKKWAESANTCPSCRGELFGKVEPTTTGEIFDEEARLEAVLQTLRIMSAQISARMDALGIPPTRRSG